MLSTASTKVQETADPRLHMPKPASHSSCWRADDLRSNESWIRQFTGLELHELYFTAAALYDCGVERHEITQRHFALPTFSAALAHARHELGFGRGVFLFRGLNVEDYSLDLLNTLYLGLGINLGTVAPQNMGGDLLRSVSDVSGSRPETADPYQARGHRGHAEMLPHTDSADVVGLLCVRPAKQGGTTTICSAAAVYAEIADKHPEFLNGLCGGFFFDMTGKTVLGVSDRRLPVFYPYGARLCCQFNKSRIEVGMKKAGLMLNELEIAALDCMSELALRPDLALRFNRNFLLSKL